MILVCESMLTHMPTRGSGGMLPHPHPPPPKENFEFRSSQIASDEIWDKIVV